MLTCNEAFYATATQSATAMFNSYMKYGEASQQEAEILPKARVLALVYERDFHEVYYALQVETYTLYQKLLPKSK